MVEVKMMPPLFKKNKYKFNVKIILNFLVFVYGTLENAADCFIIDVDEEF